MRKIMLALMGAFAGLSAAAQIIPPTHPPLIMPPTSSNAVYITAVKTSSYGYDDVNFKVTSTTLAPQNLHVYSWNAGNETTGGIAWVRRNPATNAIVDTGWIPVPGRKTCRTVGIVQDEDNNTFVIAAYYDRGNAVLGIDPGYKYETYLWTNTGVSTFPTPQPLSNPVPYTSFYGGASIYIPSGYRISMDCFDLKKVVFVWDEDYASYLDTDSVSTVLNNGALMTAVIDITTSGAPFFFDLSAYRTVSATDRWSKNADVAFAREGLTARITYMDVNPAAGASKDIYVRNALFSSIDIGTGTVAFAPDDMLPAATSMHGRPDGDHLNIDCPDHLPSADVWSIVYNPGPTVVAAHTKPVIGTNVTTILNTTIAGGINAHPVVAYGRTPSIDGINYGWYSQDPMVGSALVSNTLDWGGATFSTATPFGWYRGIDNYATTTPWNLPHLAFNRQNDRNSRFKMAYPVKLVPSNIYDDMRSKDITWGAPAFRPLGIDEAMSADASVQLYPNPFEKGFLITIKDDDGLTKYDVALIDVQGRLLLQATGNLNAINARLENLEIASGNYYLSLSSADGKIIRNIKMTKI